MAQPAPLPPNTTRVKEDMALEHANCMKKFDKDQTKTQRLRQLSPELPMVLRC